MRLATWFKHINLYVPVCCVYRIAWDSKWITLNCKTKIEAINIFRLNWKLISSYHLNFSPKWVKKCLYLLGRTKTANIVFIITSNQYQSQMVRYIYVFHILYNKSQCVAHTLFTCCCFCRECCCYRQRWRRSSWLHQIIHSSTSTAKLNNFKELKCLPLLRFSFLMAFFLFATALL